jgi:hypothetical protein
MNKVIITDSNAFENVIQVFESTLPEFKRIFQSEKTITKEIDSTPTWTGEAQRALYGKYKELEANFAPIEESMEIYIKFLKKTIEDYKKLDQELSAKANEFSEQLDVNS